jgi:long-chain acyl-CoA synthetase
MSGDTLIDYLNHWADKTPDQMWLRQLSENGSEDYSWSEARSQINQVAAALESRFGSQSNVLLLSDNCPHWIMADLAVIRSGNVTVPLFTTHSEDVVQYISEFTEAKIIFVGESENWRKVRTALPLDTIVVSLPGVQLEEADLTWEQLLKEGQGKQCHYRCQADDTISLVFTSGTTGMPKGVIQTHHSNLTPISRVSKYQNIKPGHRYFSYLPLSHLAERQLIEFTSLYECGEIHFNQSKETLAADLQRAKPNFFFGVPRVWEQLQQAVLAKFGGEDAFNSAFESAPKDIGVLILAGLGFDEADYCLTGSAPISKSLIEWWQSLGLQLMEGFGQTEAMSLIINTAEYRRTGSVGKAVGEVECKLSENGELLVKAEGLTPGYYRQPEKTAELFQGGWLHTGDKARIDEDGFIYITGRVKDYFKTIQGKFVSPLPIEEAFSNNRLVEQRCLLGRGFSKTVMVLVLTEEACAMERDAVEESISKTVADINGVIDKHARIGAVIISREPWTPDNGFMTPTLKVRREQVQDAFAETAVSLARRSAEEKSLIIHWC